MENQNIDKTLPEGLEIPTRGNQMAKISILAVAALLLFALDWWAINISLYQGKPLIFWIWPAIITAFGIAALSFFGLVNNNKTLFAFLNVGILASYIILMPKDIYVVLGGVMFFLLAMMFEQRMRSEEKSRTDFSIRRAVRGSINIIVYAMLFLIGFNIYYNTSSDFKQNPDGFYGRLSDTAIKRLGNFNYNQTLDEFLLEQSKDEDFESPQEQNEFLAESKRQFFRQFGIEASGDEQVSVIIARSISDRIKESAKPYERFFPLIFTLIIIALLRTFAFIYNWFVMFVSWVLFRILLSVRFFRIDKVPVEVDKLRI